MLSSCWLKINSIKISTYIDYNPIKEKVPLGNVLEGCSGNPGVWGVGLGNLRLRFWGFWATWWWKRCFLQRGGTGGPWWRLHALGAWCSCARSLTGLWTSYSQIKGNFLCCCSGCSRPQLHSFSLPVFGFISLVSLSSGSFTKDDVILWCRWHQCLLYFSRIDIHFCSCGLYVLFLSDILSKLEGADKLQCLSQFRVLFDKIQNTIFDS